MGSFVTARILLVVALAAGGLAARAHAGTLTLDRVLTTAELHHPALRAARTALPEAEAKILAARGGFDTRWKTSAAGVPLGNYPTYVFDSVIEQPTPFWGMSVFGGYRLGTGSFAVYDGKRVTQSGGELRAGVKIPLWRDGPIDRRRAALRQARLGREAAAAGILTRTLRVLVAAARAYWDWVAAGRKLAVARHLLGIARQRKRAIARGVRLGQIAAIEQAENERLIVRRTAAVVAARRRLEKAGIALSLFLRGPDGSPRLAAPQHLPRAFPEPATFVPGGDAGTIAEALRRRPELVGLRRQRQQAQVELRWARNQTAPRLDLRMSVATDLGTGGPKLGKPDFAVGLLVDIPLQARKERGRLAGARAKLERLEQMLRLASDRIGVQVRDARSALRAAVERIGLRRREVTLARRLEQGERKRFRLGSSNLFLVNLREQGTAAAEVKVIDALAEYQKRRAIFRAAMGCRPTRC